MDGLLLVLEAFVVSVFLLWVTTGSHVDRQIAREEAGLDLPIQKLKGTRNMKLELQALKAFLVTEKDGSINRKATHDALDAHIAEYELRNNDADSLAERGINAVFDQYKGAIIPIDALVSYAFNNLKSSPDNFSTMDAAFRKYLKANTGGKLSKFGSIKGKGVCRWVDVKANEVST